MRLPLPDSFTPELRAAFEKHTIHRAAAMHLDLPRAAQRPLAARDPIVAAVLLERGDGPAAALERLAPGAFIKDFLPNCMGEYVDAGRLLSVGQALAETAQLYKLRFSSTPVAARLLDQMVE